MVDLIPDVAFSDNTSQRTPCVLVLDGSTSMHGEPIEQLNEGLRQLEEELKSNPMTALRVQLLVIRLGGYGEVDIVSDWCDAIDFRAPVIQANGNTPLGLAMNKALDKIEEQKKNYDRNGISSTRPWIIMISDGEPNDPDWKKHAKRCIESESKRKVIIYPVGTKGADFSALGRFSRNKPKKLKGLAFGDLFVWLSRSMSVISTAAPGDKVQLPPDEWSEVEI